MTKNVMKAQKAFQTFKRENLPRNFKRNEHCLMQQSNIFVTTLINQSLDDPDNVWFFSFSINHIRNLCWRNVSESIRNWVTVFLSHIIQKCQKYISCILNVDLKDSSVEIALLLTFLWLIEECFITCLSQIRMFSR